MFLPADVPVAERSRVTPMFKVVFEGFVTVFHGQGQNRTADTGIFSPTGRFVAPLFSITYAPWSRANVTGSDWSGQEGTGVRHYLVTLILKRPQVRSRQPESGSSMDPARPVWSQLGAAAGWID